MRRRRKESSVDRVCIKLHIFVRKRMGNCAKEREAVDYGRAEKKNDSMCWQISINIVGRG